MRFWIFGGVIFLAATQSAFCAETGRSSVRLNDQPAPVASEGSAGGSTERWRNYTSAGISHVSAGTGSIVILRPINAVAGEAINVYINGEYLSSLRPGTFAQVSVCPGDNRLNIAVSDVTTRYAEKTAAGQLVSQNANSISYYKIDSNGGVLVATALNDSSAMQLLSTMPLKQHHTISRVTPRKCNVK